MAKFVQVRELKNQTTALLREVESGTTVIVTRHKKPIATLKAFEKSDAEQKTQYPTTVWDNWVKEYDQKHPEMKNWSKEERRKDFERLSKKAARNLPWKTYKEWEEWARPGKTVRVGDRILRVPKRK